MAKTKSLDALGRGDAKEFRKVIRHVRNLLDWTNADIAEIAQWELDQVSNLLKAGRVLREPVAHELFTAVLLSLGKIEDIAADPGEAVHFSPEQLHSFSLLRELAGSQWMQKFSKAKAAPAVMIPPDAVSRLSEYIASEVLGVPGIGRTELNRKRIERVLRGSIKRDRWEMASKWATNQFFRSDEILTEYQKQEGANPAVDRHVLLDLIMLIEDPFGESDADKPTVVFGERRALKK